MEVKYLQGVQSRLILPVGIMKSIKTQSAMWKKLLLIMCLFIWLPLLGRAHKNLSAYQPDSSGAKPTPSSGLSNPPNGQISESIHTGKPAIGGSLDGNAAKNQGKGTTLAKNSYIIDVTIKSNGNISKKGGAGDLIRVTISNPAEFFNQRPGELNKLQLYANDRLLPEITSDRFKNVRKGSFITADSIIIIPFELKRDTETKEAWDILFRLTGHWYKNEANVNITVGWEGMMPLDVTNNDLIKSQVTLVVFSNAVFIWMFISYLILLVGLGSLVVKTDILKDKLGGAYSLAQTQLAFWTIVVLAGFIYSLLITGIPSAMNTSILTLLGISMGTNGVAKYIEYFQKLSADIELPVNTTPVVPVGVAIPPVDPAANIPVVRGPKVYFFKTHSGFWRDILSDGGSINMQRFQILAWNIVLGAYFTFYTFKNKTMPVIPDVLLSLSGLSALTYVVAKPTEKTTSNVKT
jgi:xanthosine utilization system XapX-like protein